MLEVGQGPNRCQNEYETQLRPFLDSRNGMLSEASLKQGSHDDLVLRELTAGEVDRLKQQLDDDLGLSRRQPGMSERIFLIRHRQPPDPRPLDLGSRSCAATSLTDATEDERVDPHAVVTG